MDLMNQSWRADRPNTDGGPGVRMGNAALARGWFVSLLAVACLSAARVETDWKNGPLSAEGWLALAVLSAVAVAVFTRAIRSAIRA
jgi:hypothetical protein